MPSNTKLTQTCASASTCAMSERKSCVKCSKEIVGRGLGVEGSFYHPDCFCCDRLGMPGWWGDVFWPGWTSNPNLAASGRSINLCILGNAACHNRWSHSKRGPLAGGSQFQTTVLPPFQTDIPLLPRQILRRCKGALSGKFHKQPDGQRLCEGCKPSSYCEACRKKIEGKETKSEGSGMFVEVLWGGDGWSPFWLVHHETIYIVYLIYSPWSSWKCFCCFESNKEIRCSFVSDPER